MGVKRAIFLQKSWRVLFGGLLVVMGSLFIIGGSAEATHGPTVPDQIPPGAMPPSIETYLLDCGGSYNAAAQIGWVSAVGDPDNTSLSVGYGGSSVQLQYNVAGIVCNTSTLFGLNTTSNGVQSTNPATDLTGQVVSYNYGSSNGAYSVSSAIFTYSPSGGFTSSGTYFVEITDKRINRFGASNHQCVTNPGDVNNSVPANLTDFNACVSLGGGNYSFWVDVAPPAPNATCAISITSGVQTIGGVRYVQPGGSFGGSITVNNTGETDFDTASHYLNEIESGVEWNPLNPSTTSDQLSLPSGGVNSGASRTVNFTATAPTAAVANPTGYDFAWQVYNGSTAIGTDCETEITVTEQYQLETPTGSSSSTIFNSGQDFDWTFRTDVTNSGDGDTRNGPDTTDGTSTIRYRYLINGSVTTGIPVPSPNVDNQVINGGGTYSENETVTIPAGISVALGDEICVQARAQYRRGWEGGPIITNGTTAGPAFRFTAWGELACLRVSEQAYLEVFDNAVWAGGDFDASPVGFGSGMCDVPGGASQGYIRGAQLGSRGSFAEYIVGATDVILNFGSRAVGGDTLTFANDPIVGSFNSQGPCITDLETYLSQNSSIPGVTTTTSFPTSDGQFIRTGDMTIGSQTIPAGRQITLIVNGDVRITNDVVFASYNAATRGEIPSFILVATGDIEIFGAVENLDGIYFSKGQIDTCANGPANLSNAQCRNHLRVVGTFIANDIQFRRTYGGVSGINSNGGSSESEQFIFSQEMYLADHILISDYQPVLPIVRIVDLPPVVF